MQKISINNAMVLNPKFPYEPHEWQLAFHNAPERFRIVDCGRKFGKTEMLLRESFLWIIVPDSIVWWVAPYHNLSDMAWGRFLERISPAFIEGRPDKKNKRIYFINGSSMHFKSAENPKGLVGEGIDFCIMDEAARIREEAWLETIRPNLGDQRHAGFAAMASTPWGHNWFYREWLKGLSPDYPDYKSWSYDLNKIPIINEPVNRIDGGLPSWLNPHWKDLETIVNGPRNLFLQEYGARFIEDLGYIFNNVEGNIAGEYESPVKDKKYFMGVDVARSGDFTVISILDENNHLVHMNRFRGKKYPAQKKLIIDTAVDYNRCKILIDSTGKNGDAVYEFVADEYRNIEPYHMTNTTKRELVDNLAIMQQTGKFTFPSAANALATELKVFGANRDGATIKYEAPSGFHDDCVISVSLAAWLNRDLYSRKKIGFRYVIL